MQIRMHIIEESKAEFREMPQSWIHCQECTAHMRKEPRNRDTNHYCTSCGSIRDNQNQAAIKEPRFIKPTYKLSPFSLYK